MCSLRDAGDKLDALGVDVYGLSLDDVNSQARFVEAQELNFPLLSDVDASVAAKYGVLHPSNRFSLRVTFVIDDEGVIRHIDNEVAVGTHGDDLAGLIERLKGD